MPACICISKPRETMIALFFLGMLCLCHTHATSSQKREGDYLDANEVMWKLPLTYMLQSLGNYANLLCGYQRFYNETQTRESKTYQKYDLIFWYKDGRKYNQPRYVKNVTNYTIYMDYFPETELPASSELQILFSDMNSCMVAWNPNGVKACHLMVKKDNFSAPPQECFEKFKTHCGSSVFNYTIDGCRDSPKI